MNSYVNHIINMILVYFLSICCVSIIMMEEMNFQLYKKIKLFYLYIFKYVKIQKTYF